MFINGVAKAMGLEYSRVELTASGQIDVRGPKGVPGIRPYFEMVNLTIAVTTPESEERMEILAANVENRCPVINLIRDIGAELNVTWKRVEE